MMWEIIVVFVLLFGMSYLFGLWDHIADHIGCDPYQAMGVVAFFIAIGLAGIVFTYVAYALCHKYIGPFIFGG